MSNIEPFSNRFIRSIYASDLLYSSNCQPVRLEDKGGIESTVGTWRLLGAMPKTSWGHKIGKPVRALTRGVLLLSVGLTIAPIGVGVHTFNIVRFSITSPQEREEKIKASALAQ